MAKVGKKTAKKATVPTAAPQSSAKKTSSTAPGASSARTKKSPAKKSPAKTQPSADKQPPTASTTRTGVAVHGKAEYDAGRDIHIQGASPSSPPPELDIEA